MKDTGLVRRLDKLGRFVIPKEWRKQLDMHDDDELDIRREDDMIIIRKHSPKDIFTGETEELVQYKDKWVSKKTIEELAKLAGLME